MNGLLVDTSALSAYFRNNSGVARAIQSSPLLFLNSVILGESHCGYRAGRDRERNEALLCNFMKSSRVDVLPVTKETAIRYSKLWYHARSTGKPIPQNDLWIAATAWEHGLELLTLDAHFLNLPQILVRFETTN